MLTDNEEKQNLIDEFKEKLIGHTVTDIVLVERHGTSQIAIKLDDGLQIIGIDKESCATVLELIE